MPENIRTHSESTSPQERPAIGWVRLLRWQVVGLVLAALSSLVFSLIPPRLRLLGITAALIGWAAGWLAGKCTSPLRFHYPRRAIAATAVVGIATYALTSMLWWHAYARPLLAESIHPIQLIGDTQGDAELAAELSKEATRQRRQLASFSSYLKHRTSVLHFDVGLASLVWVLELTLAGIAAARVAAPLSRAPFCVSCQHWLHVVREQRFSRPVPDCVTSAVSGTLPDSEVSNVTVRLRMCDCADRRPRVDFEIEGLSEITIEMSAAQLQELNQEIDSTQNLSGSDGLRSANLKDSSQA